MSEPTRYKIPNPDSQKLTLTTTAWVTSYEHDKSKFGGEDQIKFTFTTPLNNHFSLWMTIASPKHVNQFLEAGIIRRVGLEEFEITPLDKQPKLRVKLKNSKLEAFFPIE